MNLRTVIGRLFGRTPSPPQSPAPTAPTAATTAVPAVPEDPSLASVLAGLRANREYAREARARNPQRRTVERIVDNRVFLLGLDELYRAGIKPHERNELLPAARAVAKKLDVQPDPGPVEGYYGEDAGLQEYFRLVRALRQVDASAQPRVENMQEFKRLTQVVSSPLFGKASYDGGLLPRGRDPLTYAMLSTTKWSVAELVQRAHTVAMERDDCSLVGLACLARDPVAITALRDSTVLYFQSVTLGHPPLPVYVWRVDDEIARRAERLVASFAELFGEALPAPTPENADLFGSAYFERASFIGRCVRMGQTPGNKSFYHWAIYADKDDSPRIHEFWADQVWTTERYQLALPIGKKGQADLSRVAYPH